MFFTKFQSKEALIRFNLIYFIIFSLFKFYFSFNLFLIELKLNLKPSLIEPKFQIEPFWFDLILIPISISNLNFSLIKFLTPEFLLPFQLNPSFPSLITKLPQNFYFFSISSKFT